MVCPMMGVVFAKVFNHGNLKFLGFKFQLPYTLGSPSRVKFSPLGIQTLYSDANDVKKRATSLRHFLARVLAFNFNKATHTD